MERLGAIQKVEAGREVPYRLARPLYPGDTNSGACICYVIMKRGSAGGGFLAVIPVGFLTHSELQGAREGALDGPIGPNTVLTVPSVIVMEDGAEEDMGDRCAAGGLQFNRCFRPHRDRRVGSCSSTASHWFPGGLGCFSPFGQAFGFCKRVARGSNGSKGCILLGRGVSRTSSGDPRPRTGRGGKRRRGSASGGGPSQEKGCRQAEEGHHYAVGRSDQYPDGDPASDHQPACSASGGAKRTEEACVGGRRERPSSSQSASGFCPSSELCHNGWIPSEGTSECVPNAAPSEVGSERIGFTTECAGASRRDASDRSAGFCSTGAEQGAHYIGDTLAAGRRSTIRNAGRCIRLFTQLKRFGGKGAPSKAACIQIRKFLSCCPAKCCPSSSTSCEAPPDHSGGSGGELFDHSIPRTLWRLRCIQRTGTDPICSCSHMGCKCARGHSRGAGTHKSIDGWNRTSFDGFQQVGVCVQDDVARRTPIAALELQEFGLRHQRTGVCSFSPTGVGNHCLGVLQRNGLCVFQEGRGGIPEEEFSAITAFSALTPQEEVSKGKASCGSPGRAVAQSGGGGPGDGTCEPWSAGAGDGSRGLGLDIRACATLGGDNDAGKDAVWGDDVLSPSQEIDEAMKEQGVASAGGIKDQLGADGSDASPMRDMPLPTWVERLVSQVCSARTRFSSFVKVYISSCRRGRLQTSPTTLFPIPAPDLSVWLDGPARRSQSKRMHVAYVKMLHLVVAALNFQFFQNPFEIADLCRRRPGPHHAQLYARLLAHIKVCGCSGSVSVSGCGRKSFQLSARMEELLKCVQSLGLDVRGPYNDAGPPKADVPRDDTVAEELRPYRSLDADRLKLSGCGQWRCEEYLPDLLYMPFMEPRCNVYDVPLEDGEAPDNSRNDYNQMLKLVRVWDVNGLVDFLPVSEAPQDIRCCTKVFNNYKDKSKDRQIGDRRGQNKVEGRIQCGSETLPTAQALLQLSPVRWRELLCCSITDRKDFYHQFAVSWEKMSLNAIYPWPLLSEVRDVGASTRFVENFMTKKKKADREVEGDHLGGYKKSLLVSGDP